MDKSKEAKAEVSHIGSKFDVFVQSYDHKWRGVLSSYPKVFSPISVCVAISSIHLGLNLMSCFRILFLISLNFYINVSMLRSYSTSVSYLLSPNNYGLE